MNETSRHVRDSFAHAVTGAPRVVWPNPTRSDAVWPDCRQEGSSTGAILATDGSKLLEMVLTSSAAATRGAR